MNGLKHVLLGTALIVSAPASADVKAGVDAWSRGDYTQAVAAWRPIAVAGDADAEFNIAQAYKLGRGVTADGKLAEQWYRKAALQGHVQAEDNYGLILFQNGKRAEAMPYIEASAGRGDPRAQYIFGTALFNGDLTPKDWPRAYALMTRASAAGIAAASTSLAQMDRYIPLDQRQNGLALARAFEAAATRTLVMTEPPVAQKRPAQLLPPKPAAQGVFTAPPSGNWRVQLGAFGDPQKANSLWRTLKTRVPALALLKSYPVQAAAFTRLQAGPVGSRAAAEKLCIAIKAVGNPCLPVAPYPPKR